LKQLQKRITKTVFEKDFTQKNEEQKKSQGSPGGA